MVQNDKRYDLEERTLQFSKDTLSFCGHINKTIITQPLVGQLVRSATSIGANYREANAAISKRDFRNKVFICKKEARETCYWLELLAEASESIKPECRKLWKEAHELILIFGKITTVTK